MTVTKAKLAGALHEELGLSQREAKALVDDLFEEVRAALEAGEPVRLSGFGNLGLREKPERPGRNPKTGEKVAISARRVVTFHAGNKLRARCEAYAPSADEDEATSPATVLGRQR